MIQEITCPQRRREIAQAVLFALPEWFGLPESTAEYVRLCGAAPFWAAMVENRPVGFIAMKETSPCTAEILVMGVLPQYHRHGRRCIPAPKAWAMNFFRSKPCGRAAIPNTTVPTTFIGPWASGNWNAFPRCGMHKIPVKSISCP